jgi:predicted ABC-type ATPase
VAPWADREGYSFHLLFLWLPSVELAIGRVADRVRMGGQGVPEAVIRRRYHAGLRNFFRLYRPLATTWRVYDNSVRPLPVLVASGRGRETTHVAVPPTWEGIFREHADEGC